jgi:hypothetical protein
MDPRKMKTYFRMAGALLLLPVVLVLTLNGCQKAEKRDLSTPAARLIGHWKSMTGGVEVYYSPIDEATGKGTMTTDPKRPEVGTISNDYTVESETADGEALAIMLSDGQTMKFKMDLEISKNGLFMFMDARADVKAEYRYMNELTAPAAAKK